MIDLHLLCKKFEKVYDDIVDICPYCWAKAHMEKKFFDFHKYSDYIYEGFFIFKCVPCERLCTKILYVEENHYNRWAISGVRWVEKYPRVLDNDFNTENIKYIPKEVYDDFKEWLNCHSIWCYKASATMFRRSLQSALLELWCNENDSLKKQIQSLDKLDDNLKEWATEIRQLWNWWAHPKDDELQEVTKEVSEDICNFLSKFLEYVFVMPWKVLISKKKRWENKK